MTQQTRGHGTRGDGTWKVPNPSDTGTAATGGPGASALFSYHDQVVQRGLQLADRYSWLKCDIAGSICADELPVPHQIIKMIAARGRHPCRKRRVFLSAGLHGDEPAGVYAILKFFEDHADDYLANCSFEAFPCLNPVGFEQQQRYNLQGLDINRHFGSRHGTPESRILQSSISGRFDLAIDLHEDDRLKGPPEAPELTAPAGLYIYESCRHGFELARRILAGIPSGQVCTSSEVYGDRCENGVINSVRCLEEGCLLSGELEEFLVRHDVAKRALTFETEAEHPLHERVQQHVDMICRALDELS